MANGGIIGPVVTPPNVQTQSAPGVWTLQEAQEYIRQGLWPRRYDPLYNYTTLLLSGNGANNATNSSFLDSSSNNFTITRNGNTTQGTFSPFAQTGWGNYFDGTGDYLSIADNSVLRLGTSNFTIECWVNRAANGTAHSILAKGGASTGWLLEVTSGNLLQFTHTTTTITTSLPVYAGNWVHVAAVREGTGSNQFKLYINGTLAQTATMSTDFTQTDTLYIGANRSAATTMNGYISNVRIVNGAALYTAQFTPSTTPLTTTSQGATASQVELLTCQSNRFLDNSGNGFTVTPAGNSAVVSFSPFNATSPWDPLTYGGGGYFDGSGDYLTVANTTALQLSNSIAWTIETWFYATTVSVEQQIFNGYSQSSPYPGWGIALGTGGAASTTLRFWDGTSWRDIATSITAGQWYHVAVAYDGSGTTGRLYLNGNQQGSSFAPASTINNTSTAIGIGAPYNGASPFSGYISGARVVKGTAVYTGSTYTVPTAPLTAITNTSLLLNFTNIGVTDATSKNILETVGNAKISTAQSKFGGSSIVFDGTGDYLNISPERFSSFGTGSFTVEFWMKTSGSNFNIINPATATGTGYWALLVQTGNGGFRWNDAYNVTNLWTQTATSVLDNNWHHIAIVRNGTGSGNVNIYFDGVAQGTAKTDSTNYNGALTAWRVGSGNAGDFNGYLQDLRITPGVARYTENFAVPDSAFATLGNTPPSIDPYFDYTTLLLPGSGSNNATNSSFLDSSANNFTITRNGNTTQGTFSPFSQTGWGNYFDGTGDYLSTPNVAGLRLGAGDFCIEAWIYPTRLTNTYEQSIAGTHGYVSGSDKGYELYLNASGYPAFFIGNTSGVTQINLVSSTLATANSWNHIAAVRNGSSTNNVKLYLNGVQVAQGTTTYDDTWTGADFNIGTTRTDNLSPALGNSGTSLQGYISNVRFVKGSPVYTSAFTPPTAPLTAITNTSLLTCQSNRFIDNSSNAFTITANGNTSVVAFSPFNPTASWSAATNGGSGYFDGSGDYLNTSYNAAFDFGTGDFTLETWFYLTAAQGDMSLIGSYDGAVGVTTGYIVRLGSNFVRFLYRAGSNTDNIIDRTISFSPSSWNHLAVVRSSGVLTFYANGAQIGATASLTASINAVSTASYVIGQVASANYLTGYLSNTRVVKGTAVYTAAFTPPTSPLTAITNTSLLLTFTNAGIYDATSKNDLETVADAKISTAQSVWTAYGASMSFDGTGDWLTVIDQPVLRLGTGNFTVEMWLYLNATGAARGLVGKGDASNGWLVSLNSSNNVVFTYGTSTITSTGTISASVWTHITVVREGTSTNQTKIYINGTNDGTGTVSTDFTQTNTMYVGANRTGGDALNGYLQDLRITRWARYTSAFQPPSAPLALR